MDKLLLSPPVAFLIMLGVVTLFATALSKLSLKPKKHGEGEGKSYACGEDVPTHLMQPDYSQFFPFAFFFTVLHVVALMIATVPIETMESFSIAIIYIAGALVGMAILFRR
jgi:NADH:ubiquinone oxidoreductase subunit 3 (subunit A)